MPPLSMMYWNASVMNPPAHPLFPYIPEQSTRFWALRDTKFPVFSFTCASRAPTALKAQQDPQAPWEKKIPGEAQELPQGSPGGSRGEAHLVLHLGHASLVPPVQRLRDVTDGPGLGLGLGLECRIPTGTELEPRQRSRHLLAGLVGRKIPAGDSCSLRSPAEGVGAGIPRWESWVWGILSSLFFSV